jgi:hypothetical protein
MDIELVEQKSFGKVEAIRKRGFASKNNEYEQSLPSHSRIETKKISI